MTVTPVRLVFATLFLALAVSTNPSRVLGAQDAEPDVALFNEQLKPFFKTYCVRCHNEEEPTSGIRVDQLDASLPDRQLKLWRGVRKQIASGAMPPEDEPQPSAGDRKRVEAWVAQALDRALARPTPRNGGVRRLTVAQYGNTLRELLQIDENLTEILPPDAVSRDGFVNQQDTLTLSPLLLETYLEIAEKALSCCIVDTESQPTIQCFRVDLGRGINSAPCPDALILGANSLLLDNSDFVVTQPMLKKRFAFKPFVMRTRYRFIEGYAGNDTVRGWREYDSIYHAVFACMRGSPGYPKGLPYSVVPEGLLLRPSIANDEIFGEEGTYGPRANFKISLRELPDQGRFRITVLAARYEDALLLDPGASARPPDRASADVRLTPYESTSVLLNSPGIYQVDIHPAPADAPVSADASRLADGLVGAWMLDGNTENTTQEPALSGQLRGDARLVDSPFGKAVTLDGKDDGVEVPSHESIRFGEGEFTVAAWIHPKTLRQSGILSRGGYGWTHGWLLDMPDATGKLRIETASAENQSNGTVESAPGAIRANVWQHVAAVVRRGTEETRLYVNGSLVAKGRIGSADLNNPRLALQIGALQGGPGFRGELDEPRVYRRALNESEIQALVEPGRRFVPPARPAMLEQVTLRLGRREFASHWEQPAFLAVRLDAGRLSINANATGLARLDRIVFTKLADDDPLAESFVVFEQRAPRLGVHVGLRRDCGSTLTQVGSAQTVSGSSLSRYVFEGAIRNFPSPDVENDNVNYLAGLREIGVRSEYTDGRDMPRLLIRSVEFEGPLHEEWPPAEHRRIFLDSDHVNDPATRARLILRNFATRAFRRPITIEEETFLIQVFERSFAAGAGFSESVKDALLVVLTSPQFLFLIEKSETPAPEPLDDFELASKLSYVLWNGPPDSRMRALAESGRLRQELDSEIDRMIDDRRFERFTREFVSQWLSLDKFQVLEPDRGRFPRLTRAVRSELVREPVEFVQYLIRRNLPARNLIASDFVVANEVVASYYDLADRTESGFRFEVIPHERPDLGGVLSQAAILAGLSNGREPNPVKRGAWLARKIIAEPPDDPPPNVPALKEESEGLTIRQRLEQHRNQRGCVQCHAKIDPWGLPFEEYDAGGRKSNKPAEAQSQLPDGTEIDGVAELKRYLASDRVDQVAFSVLRHLMVYATGRGLSPNEIEVLKRDALKLKADDYRMRDMLRYVVTSSMFLEK